MFEDAYFSAHHGDLRSLKKAKLAQLENSYYEFSLHQLYGDEAKYAYIVDPASDWHYAHHRFVEHAGKAYEIVSSAFEPEYIQTNRAISFEP